MYKVGEINIDYVLTAFSSLGISLMTGDERIVDFDSVTWQSFTYKRVPAKRIKVVSRI